MIEQLCSSAAPFGGRVATSRRAEPPTSYGQWWRVRNDIRARQLLIETATPDAGVDRSLTHSEFPSQRLGRTVLSQEALILEIPGNHRPRVMFR